MSAIWTALNNPISRPISYRAQKIMLEAFKEGWFRSCHLEDIIYESDHRLDDLRHTVDVKALSEALGYRWSNITYRPRLQSIGVSYSYALPIAGLAALLVDLEKLGFQFDPGPVIEKIRPALLKQKILTDDELTVFWSPRIRGKADISLHVEEEDRSYGGFKEGRFPNGYRYSAMLRADGQPFSLTIKGPKHRHISRPKETLCDTCGYKWWRGDPDSSQSHRKEHKWRMHVLAPQPNELMIEAKRAENDAELVTTVSPAWKHQEIYRRAFAFKREMRFDFVQWQSSSGDDDPHVHGFLFTNEDGVIVGAVAFRLREPEAPYSPHWGLQWAWIAPPFRRQGILASRWPMLRERFGDFVVEGPVSEAMQSFLIKRGDTALLRWPESRNATDA